MILLDFLDLWSQLWELLCTQKDHVPPTVWKYLFWCEEAQIKRFKAWYFKAAHTVDFLTSACEGSSVCVRACAWVCACVTELKMIVQKADIGCSCWAEVSSPCPSFPLCLSNTNTLTLVPSEFCAGAIPGSRCFCWCWLFTKQNKASWNSFASWAVVEKQWMLTLKTNWWKIDVVLAVAENYNALTTLSCNIWDYIWSTHEKSTSFTIYFMLYFNGKQNYVLKVPVPLKNCKNIKYIRI